MDTGRLTARQADPCNVGLMMSLVPSVRLAHSVNAVIRDIPGIAQPAYIIGKGISGASTVMPHTG